MKKKGFLNLVFAICLLSFAGLIANMVATAISTPTEVVAGKLTVDKGLVSIVLGLVVAIAMATAFFRAYPFCLGRVVHIFSTMIVVLVFLSSLAIECHLRNNKKFQYHFLTEPNNPDARQRVVHSLWTYSYLASNCWNCKWEESYEEAARAAGWFGYRYPTKPEKFPNWGMPPLTKARR